MDKEILETINNHIESFIPGWVVVVRLPEGHRLRTWYLADCKESEDSFTLPTGGRLRKAFCSFSGKSRYFPGKNCWQFDKLVKNRIVTIVSISNDCTLVMHALKYQKEDNLTQTNSNQ